MTNLSISDVKFLHGKELFRVSASQIGTDASRRLLYQGSIRHVTLPDILYTSPDTRSAGVAAAESGRYERELS
jgi:hypothetical protein